MNITKGPYFAATFIGNQALVSQFPELATLAEALKKVPESDSVSFSIQRYPAKTSNDVQLLVTDTATTGSFALTLGQINNGAFVETDFGEDEGGITETLETKAIRLVKVRGKELPTNA